MQSLDKAGRADAPAPCSVTSQFVPEPSAPSKLLPKVHAYSLCWITYLVHLASIATALPRFSISPSDQRVFPPSKTLMRSLRASISDCSPAPAGGEP
jgi:hypothetical protein